jgi:hypothetical protein
MNGGNRVFLLDLELLPHKTCMQVANSSVWEDLDGDIELFLAIGELLTAERTSY